MTIKQRQCLLLYLGYYTGSVDGKWGTRSIKATKNFQTDYGIYASGTCDAETEKALKDAVANGMPKPKDFWEGIKYFKRSEFKCKCGKCGGFPVEPDKALVTLLEKIRVHFGAAVTVTSGVRCATYNSNPAVGGAKSSQHLNGTAADIKVKGVAPEKVAAYAETLLPKTGGIGRYKTFTHVDVRTKKSRWNG